MHRLTRFTGLARLIGLFAVFSLCAVPAAADAPRPARSELSKAVGKCMAALVAGGVLGGVFGGSRGAKIGLLSGGALCAVLVKVAKHQDEIIAAERDAAMTGQDVTRQVNVDGKVETLTVRTSAPLDPGPVRPVAYTSSDGQSHVSPDLGTGPRQCRVTSPSLAGADGSSNVPGEIICRTPNGDYEPYSKEKV